MMNARKKQKGWMRYGTQFRSINSTIESSEQKARRKSKKKQTSMATTAVESVSMFAPTTDILHREINSVPVIAKIHLREELLSSSGPVALAQIANLVSLPSDVLLLIFSLLNVKDLCLTSQGNLPVLYYFMFIYYHFFINLLT